MTRRTLLWAGSAAMVLALLLGTWVTIAGPDAPTAVDRAWNAWLAQVRGPGLVVFGQVMDNLGGHVLGSFVIPPLILLPLLLFGRWRAWLFACAAALGNALVVQVLKIVFGRVRPEDILVVADAGSFPSGHTANAAALAAVFWVLFPRWWVGLIGAAWTVAMGFSRNLIAAHWLTDVVGGALVGVGLTFLLAALLLPWVRRQGAAALALPEAEPAPPSV